MQQQWWACGYIGDGRGYSRNGRGYSGDGCGYDDCKEANASLTAATQPWASSNVSRR